MSIVLFGPPGAGKGTQSALLIENLGMVQISTGDLFRANIKNGTDLGVLAKSFMDKGALVPDSVTIDMVRNFLQGNTSVNYIFDGFPRTVSQGDALEGLLSEFKIQLRKAIFLEVPRSELMGRLTGRRVCKACGSVFHVQFKPTQREGICDSCGGEVVQRNDDKEEVIGNRLTAYDASTLPLKEYYRSKGILSEISGLGETEEVFARIKQQLT